MSIPKIALIFCIIFLIGKEAHCQDKPNDTTSKLLTSLRASSADTNRLSLLLKLGNHYILLPGEKKSDLDSAIIFLRQAIKLSDDLHTQEWHYKALLSLGIYYFESGVPDTGKNILKKVISYYQGTGDMRSEANAWEQLGSYMLNAKNSNRTEALACSEKAINLYRKIGNKLKVLELHEEKGVAYVIDGRYDEAEKVFLMVHDGFKKMNYYGELDGNALDWLVYIAAKKSEFNKELLYALENLDNLQKHPEAFSESREDVLYFQLSGLYRELGNIVKSEYFAKKELSLSLKLKKDYIFSLVNLIPIIIKQGRPKEALQILRRTVKTRPPDSAQKIVVYPLYGDIYAALNQNKIAENYYQLAVRCYELLDPKHQDLNKLIFPYEAISQFYVNTNQFKKAEPYFAALNVKNLNISPLQKSQLTLLKSKIDSASGRYLPALQSFQFYKRLNDSIFNVEKSRQINLLEISFETKQKQNEIKLLAAQNKSNLAQAREANVERNFTVAGIVVMFIISGGIFYGFRNKIKRNRLLTAKNLEIDQQKDNLQKLLGEKEDLLGEKDMLLKEVHHRVKNNLQIVMSLLSTQVAYLENKDAVQAVEDSQQRVQAIALIHQKLYRETGGVSIQMESYVADMVEDLDGVFNARKRNIRFEKFIDVFNLDIDQAVPVGLILNEALTNAIKYAFIGKGGIVKISLQKAGDQHINLTIADNGIGLPSNFDFENTNSLGMEMMKGLGQQLRGKFEITNESGVTLSLKFPLSKSTFD